MATLIESTSNHALWFTQCLDFEILEGFRGWEKMIEKEDCDIIASYLQKFLSTMNFEIHGININTTFRIDEINFTRGHEEFTMYESLWVVTSTYECIYIKLICKQKE